MLSLVWYQVELNGPSMVVLFAFNATSLLSIAAISALFLSFSASAAILSLSYYVIKLPNRAFASGFRALAKFTKGPAYPGNKKILPKLSSDKSPVKT